MKTLGLACLVLIGGFARGENSEAESPLVQDFKKDTPTVLDNPFIGRLLAEWPNDAEKPKPEAVRLNLLRPADPGNWHSPINTPYLATSKDGESYWGAFALRSKLPGKNVLISFKTYKDFIELLGSPTHLPISGDIDDKWAYDTVSWRLFAPSMVDSIEILEVRIARKRPLDGGEYFIESLSLRRGTLTKSKQAGTGQPATRPESKPEGNQKPQPKSEGRSR